LSRYSQRKMLFKNILSWLFVGLVLFVTLSFGYPADSQGASTDGDPGVGLAVIKVGNQPKCPIDGQEWVRGRCRTIKEG
jgi:hypothetical protein